MAHQVHPMGWRLGFNVPYKSNWFAPLKQYPKLLLEDEKLRKFVEKKLESAGVGDIVIERPNSTGIVMTVYTTRPGLVIGFKGKDVESLCSALSKEFGKEVMVNVREITNPDGNARMIAQKIAAQLEARTSYRRAMRAAKMAAMRTGIKGISITCTGVMGGAIAKTEKVLEGSVPFSTIRERIDYASVAALTRAGKVGVRVTVSHGTEKKQDSNPDEIAAPVGLRGPRRYGNPSSGTNTREGWTPRHDNQRTGPPRTGMPRQGNHYSRSPGGPRPPSGPRPHGPNTPRPPRA